MIPHLRNQVLMAMRNVVVCILCFILSRGVIAFLGGWKVRQISLKLASSSPTIIPTLKNVQLLHNNVLVRIKPSKESTLGGIIIPDNAKSKANEGVAVSVGPGLYNEYSGNIEALTSHAGDYVVYGKYDGVEMLHDGSPHHIIKDGDVIVRFKPQSGIEDELSIDVLECTRDNILVKLAKPEERSIGGIVVNTASSNANMRIDNGEVVKVGPGVTTKDGKVLLPMSATVGDTVRFREYAGTELKIGGIRYSIVKNKDLIAKM